MTVFLVAWALLVCGRPAAAKSSLGQRATAELNAAYAALRAGDKQRARAELEQAVKLDPANATALKQLAYLDLQEGRLHEAAAGFEKACGLDPRDYTACLQLGYIDYGLKDWRGAEAAFHAAGGSPDPQQREQARSALRTTRAASRRFFLEVYGSPLYMTRFGDAVGYLEGQYHFKPTPQFPASIYAGTRYVQDTRSRGGNLPQIYNDNIWEAGPGIRIQPSGWEASLSIEENIAFNLVRSPSHPRNTEGDFRAVLAGYHDFEGPRAFADIGASAGYYSRFDNAIAYAQLRQGLPIWKSRHQRLLGYVRENLSGDKNADFFNNVAELGPGLELWPWSGENLKIRGEFLHGMYFGRQKSGEPNPYGPTFDDFRVGLLFGARF